MQLPPRVTERAFAQLAEIGAADQGQALRVAVEGGGCSGFQYEIKLDHPGDDDRDVQLGQQSLECRHGAGRWRGGSPKLHYDIGSRH